MSSPHAAEVWDLTPAQKRAVVALVELCPVEGRFHVVRPTSPRAFARKMWPDSPAWNRVTHRGGAGGPGGAQGGTMPMKGARMLWTLHRLGLAYTPLLSPVSEWKPTAWGRVIAGRIEGGES